MVHSLIVIIFLGVFYTFSPTCHAVSNEPSFHAAKGQVTRQNAIEKAKEEATRLGYDVAAMVVEVTKHDKPWNELLPKGDKSAYTIEHQNELQGKRYWAVKFSPRQMMLGGSLCVFIDSTTGDVVSVVQWK